jgi:hypothetical protein
MWQMLFATSCRVLAANRRLALINPVHAITKADTGTNTFFIAALQFIHQMRVSDMRAGHTNQINCTAVDRMARSGGIGNPPRM